MEPERPTDRLNQRRCRCPRRKWPTFFANAYGNRKMLRGCLTITQYLRFFKFCTCLFFLYPKACYPNFLAPKSTCCHLGGVVGWVKSKRRRAESQRIVAARPLCLLQYPVAYLSRLQRILPVARWELNFTAANAAHPPRWLRRRHVPLGAQGPYCWSANGRRAHASLLARILT